MYCQSLDEAKVILDGQISCSNMPCGPILNRNMPKVAGSLIWSEQLKERVTIGMRKVKTFLKE